MSRAGDFRDVITIQTVPVSVDPIGGQTEGEPIDFIVDLPAAVDPLDTRMERIQIGQLRGAISKKIRIRYRDDVTESMLVKWLNRTLEIGQVDLVPRQNETHLYCAEVNP